MPFTDRGMLVLQTRLYFRAGHYRLQYKHPHGKESGELPIFHAGVYTASDNALR